MFKTILALIAVALLAPIFARAQISIPVVRGKQGAEETKIDDDLDPYGGSSGRHTAAVEAFQDAYTAAAQHRERAMRLFLVSLHREPMPKALYNLGILCARDFPPRWEDALNFQREAQQQVGDLEVAKLASMEIERLRAVMELESAPAGKQQREFDILFIPVLDKTKTPFAALNDLREITKRYNTHWEAFALEGILYGSAEVHNFPESLKAFEEAARLAPAIRRPRLKEAAELARGEAGFDEQRISGDELWDKNQYEAAAKHYRAAWESSPGHVDVALKAATGFLMDDKVDLAVQVLSSVRTSATGDMRAKVEAMLKELGAISDRGKIQAASAPGASGGPSNMDTAARLRTLVGQLSSRQMELAAKSDPPLLADKTDIIHVPDKNLTGPQTNLPFLAESIYTLYTRDRPAASVPPAAAPEPAANPPAPAPMAQAPPSAAKPAPMANLPPPLTPPPSAEPTRSLAEAPHVPGELPVSVVSDPPGAMVTFDGYNNLNCTAPCQISLGAGRHTWRATHDGYRDGLGVYNIEKGKKPVPVNITLDAKLGFVTVESKIAGLPIFLNGQKTEYQTPSRIKLREGLYKVSVEIDGNMLTQDLNMRDGAFMRVSF
jgi:tetratricopeptide (TPR) repeat protein